MTSVETGSNQYNPIQAWIEHADGYVNVVDGKNDGRGKLLREEVLYSHLLRQFKDLEGKTVLDAGTGEGSFARLLLEHGAKKVIGIDIVETLAQEAVFRSYGKEEVVIADLNTDPNETGQPKNICRLPFADSSFDAIVCSLVAMWIPNIQGLGPEFARISKRAAPVVIAILNPTFNKSDKNGMKLIDNTAGPFPYFNRSGQKYKRSLERRSANSQLPYLHLVDTEYAAPHGRDLVRHPSLIPRLIPEFIIYSFRTIKDKNSNH